MVMFLLTTEEMKKLAKMMMQMFNDGYEQVVIPRLQIMQETRSAICNP